MRSSKRIVEPLSQPYTRIVDPIGTVRIEVRAPRAGQLRALRTFATLYAAEMVAWIL